LAQDAVYCCVLSFVCIGGLQPGPALEAMSVDLSTFNSLVQRLEGVADRLERNGGPAAAGDESAQAVGRIRALTGSNDPAVVIAFDAFIKEKAVPIEAAATTLAVADVTEATQFFMEALRLLRGILVATGTCRKPKDAEWTKFFGPVNELNQKASKACDNRSDFFQHRKAATEALGVVMLVTQPGTAAYVTSVLETMDYNGVKVMQKKNPPETAWINALKTCLKDLTAWCNENIKMGVDWKAGGEDPVAYFAATPLGSAGCPSNAKGKGKGGGPAVPKGGFAAPPPPDAGTKRASVVSGSGGGMNQIMGAISGFSTGGLKKVTDDQKCKNMKDAPVKVATKPKPRASVASQAAGRFAKGPKGDPTKVLQDSQNTWFVQNFDGDHNVTLEEADKQHVVRITDCRNCTVKIAARVKAVAIDNCERITIQTNDVISAIECMNSDRVKVQTTGKVNLFCIDKCDGCNIWLNKESIGAEIVTSKSSEMNVTIPDDKGDEYDTIEIPIPEQFKNTINGRKIKTEVSDLYSG